MSATEVYTFEEAAAALRLTVRQLRDWLRLHPGDRRGVPFYSRMGRARTFDASDLARVRHEAREIERKRLGLDQRPVVGRRASRTSDSDASDVVTAALALARGTKPVRKSSKQD